MQERPLALALALALLCGNAPGLPAGQDPEGTAPQQTPQARLEALLERYRQAQQDWMERLQEAADDPERDRIYAEEPSPRFVDPFLELARESAGSETAATAWIWVGRLAVQSDRLADAVEALRILVAEHVRSPQMVEVASELRYGSSRFGRERSLEALRAILAGTRLPEVKATAQYVLATVLLQRPTDQERGEARALLVELAEGAGDAGEVRWAERAAAALFELDRLQIGMVAPDFEAVDQDGVAWKLSDYRGKVVVLDFWGFW